MHAQQIQSDSPASSFLLSNGDYESEFIDFDYSDAVLIGNEHAFNSIQIQPFSFCEDENMGGDFFDGFGMTFAGLYLHMKEGGIVRVGEFGNVDLAEEAASKLACKYGWPIYNFIR